MASRGRIPGPHGSPSLMKRSRPALRSEGDSCIEESRASRQPGQQGTHQRQRRCPAAQARRPGSNDRQRRGQRGNGLLERRRLFRALDGDHSGSIKAGRVATWPHAGHKFIVFIPNGLTSPPGRRGEHTPRLPAPSALGACRESEPSHRAGRGCRAPNPLRKARPHGRGRWPGRFSRRR